MWRDTKNWFMICFAEVVSDEHIACLFISGHFADCWQLQFLIHPGENSINNVCIDIKGFHHVFPNWLCHHCQGYSWWVHRFTLLRAMVTLPFYFDLMHGFELSIPCHLCHGFFLVLDWCKLIGAQSNNSLVKDFIATTLVQHISTILSQHYRFWISMVQSRRMKSFQNGHLWSWTIWYFDHVGICSSHKWFIFLVVIWVYNPQ